MFNKATVQGYLAMLIVTTTVAVAAIVYDVALLKELSLIALGFYLRHVDK